MIDAIFVQLAQPWVPWALCGLIVLFALALWLDFRWFRLRPFLAGLDDAIDAIEETEGQASFRQRFQAVYRRLAENRVVGEAWRAYAPTLSPAPGNDDAIGYTRRPADSFNESLLAGAGIDLRFYHAVPNMLVGVGLLFTFIGLVAALYFASAGVAAVDVKVAQEALRELLAAATFKFVTSIAGLACSLVFSWREKAQMHVVRRRLGRLCSALEARMVPVTGGSVAAAQLAELRQHTQQLQRLTKDLYVRLPEGLETGIAGEIGKAMAPLREALAEAAPDLRRIAEPLVATIAGSLAAQVPRSEAVPQPARTAVPVPPAAASAQAITGRLDGALVSLRAGLDRLWGLRGGKADGEAVRQVERLLHDGRNQLVAAQAAARELQARLDGLARGEGGDGLDGAVRESLRRVEALVGASTARLGEAVGELERRR
ncbi:MAG: hypothetical protein U1E14_05970 [Geminicoccaceae bacterium]